MINILNNFHNFFPKTCRREKLINKKISLAREYYYKRIQEKGFLYCISRGIQRIAYLIICHVIGFLAYPIFRLKNMKFIFISEKAIGHLCVELDCYIKEGLLGIHPAYNAILIVHPAKVSNWHLLEYWKKYFKVISSPFLCSLIKPLAQNSFTGYQTYRFAFSENMQSFPQIQRKYDDRPPLLSLSKIDYERGWDCLTKSGVRQGSWFVCVHCREDGYKGNVNQSYRNADINNYLLAMEFIVKQGGWIVRMGDTTMKTISSMKHVLDYAHMDIKSEQMDLFLCASCRFLLGSVSGLCHLCNVFGVPTATANRSHYAGILPYGVSDIGIPKLIWSERLGRYLTFKEILESPVSNFMFDHLFIETNLHPLQNSPEDIKDLAVEMLERAEGRAIYAPEDELLQQRFKALMNKSHYSFGAISRIGRDFLRKYSYLIGDNV